MRQLLALLTTALLAASLAGCSGQAADSTTAPLFELDRSTQHDPPRPEPGCPQFFDIALTCNLPGRPDPMEKLGHLMLDTCVTPDNSNDVFIAFKLRDEGPILRLRGTEVDCPGDGPTTCYAGRQVHNIGNRERGAHIEWRTKFGLHETNAGGSQVRGELVRVRVRWWTDRSGERQEDTDRLVCTFIGRAGDPPGGGD